MLVMVSHHNTPVINVCLCVCSLLVKLTGDDPRNKFASILVSKSNFYHARTAVGAVMAKYQSACLSVRHTYAGVREREGSDCLFSIGRRADD